MKTVIRNLMSFMVVASVGNVMAQNQMGADILGDGSGDHSGVAISLDDTGEIIAVGADYNNSNGNSDAGHVKVYQWQDTAWVQMGTDIDGEAANDQSGWSVSLSGDATTVAVGARFNDGNGTDAGHVRVYEWNGTNWMQKGGDLDGEAAGDEFGQTVSLSNNGDMLAVGARYNDGAGTDAGHVRVFEWNGTAWVQLGNDIDGEAAGDYSGQSVSLSSDGLILAVGERRNDDNGIDAGQVRVFEWNGSAWVQVGNDLNGDNAGDQMGWAVRLNANGNILVVSAPKNDAGASNAGRVKIYSWDGTAWVQLGGDIDGDTTNDDFGWSLDINDQGTIFSVGARQNDTQLGGLGQVRLYEWDGVSWLQKGIDLNGDLNGDQFGFSCALNNTGSIVAGGAYLHSNGGIDNGQVKVFCFPPVADSLPDVEDCQNYTLPAINSGDYYSGPGGTGSLLLAGDIISSSQTVYIYAVNGSCEDEQSFQVNILDCTGIDEVESYWKIYPNPAQEMLQIEVSSEMIGQEFTIFDISGRQIFSGNLTSQVSVLETSWLDAGTYFISIDSGKSRKQLIIMK